MSGEFSGIRTETIDDIDKVRDSILNLSDTIVETVIETLVTKAGRIPTNMDITLNVHAMTIQIIQVLCQVIIDKTSYANDEFSKLLREINGKGAEEAAAIIRTKLAEKQKEKEKVSKTLRQGEEKKPDESKNNL